MSKKPILSLLLHAFCKSESRSSIAQTSQSISLQRPLKANDVHHWCEHWQQLSQPWRTEPEIDAERQKYLAERRSITPVIEQGIYPFKDIKLSRADVEWLLSTHENGRGPIDWSDESQREREGIDLRGADLRGENLSGLPLACICGGPIPSEWEELYTRLGEEVLSSLNQALLVVIHLEEADLTRAHLERANLSAAHLERANLSGAYLKEAILIATHLEGAKLNKAYLEGAYLNNAHLVGAFLKETHLEGTTLTMANLEEASLNKANLSWARLEEANLERAHLEEANLGWALLAGANLSWARLAGIYLESTRLCNDKYRAIGPRLADASWGDANLRVVDWGSVRILGDEYEARTKMHKGKQVKPSGTRLKEYQRAVRANSTLALVLRSQGLNEEAAHFAYREQLLKRVVFRRQRKFAKYLASFLLYLISGYGYKLWRSFATYLFVVVGFATAYDLLGPTAKLSLTPLEAIVFSLTSFHGRGFSPGEGNIGLSNPLTVLAAIEAFVGLIIEVTLIATLTQRFFNK